MERVKGAKYIIYRKNKCTQGAQRYTGFLVAAARDRRKKSSKREGNKKGITHIPYLAPSLIQSNYTGPFD